ncbi:MAG: peptidoglycan synthetase [Flavobacteriia bacterium]|nr:peptidoglycan synthetase [Flavobacteriia bacterium]NBV68035.1 peptidoglycan synthetase [Flavobacteriia bacterium]
MHIHFIAIGGSAMHNLAIALNRKGYKVTGSDDEILDPSRTRLEKEGILPDEMGWFPNKITEGMDGIILGMHAREDNPELLQAKNLNVPIYSYPEYLYEASKDKIRVVIGGSHGKTTITSMILHAAKKLDFPLDFMVGAQLEGYDCMVQITDEAKFILLEGDEYLSSPIDRRPKFHLYKPHIALISGIAWDHINVFPTFENYVEQFDIFIQQIEPNGVLVYNEEDPVLQSLAVSNLQTGSSVAYQIPEYEVNAKGTLLKYDSKEYPLLVFGEHNLQNLMGAMFVAEAMGINAHNFLQAMSDFTGAGKRLQKVVDVPTFKMFKDFAHSPSKLKATTAAVKNQFKSFKLVACMELHTFSSLKKEFLPQYLDTMKTADTALVYFNPKVVAHKKLESITKEMVYEGFGGNVVVVNDTQSVLDFIHKEVGQQSVLLMMSSGNFDGINFDELGAELSTNLS